MSKILVNSVYVGDYGVDKNNLPHEMINFFRADNGGYYIYVTPYGVLQPSFDISDLKAVLFVRNAGNALVEVLAKAELDKNSKLYTKGIELYGHDSDPAKIRSMKDATFMQKRRKSEYENDTKDITYGGKTLPEIHSKNAKDNDVYVTMQVKSICLPARTFFLTHKESATSLRPDVYYVGQEMEDTSRIANQSMKKYFDEKDNPQGFQELSCIIEDDSLWKSPECTPKIEEAPLVKEQNFFKITRQQDNEVMFSNMFFYLFTEHPELLQKFAKDVLDLSLDTSPLVEREKDHMDLRIIDDTHYIIIENKIKSSINGMKKNETGKDFLKQDGKYISQLSEYYAKAQKQNQSDGKSREIECFLFTPNYNQIKKDDYLDGDKYEIVEYSNLYKFFSDYLKSMDEEDTDYIYLKDFVSAMEKHTTYTDNEFRDELLLRLADRIKNS